ncbi:helix-turn-helix transcriptional regulator [soil metagenome]
MMFGDRIRELRKGFDLTLRELAQQVGIDFTYLSKIENGHGPAPAESTIRRIASALNTDAEELIILANKLPIDFERDLLERPPNHVAELYRSMAGKQYSDDEWQQILELLRDSGARS